MRAAIVPLAVRAGARGTEGCTVVKVGGGLLQHDGALEHVVSAIVEAHTQGAPLVVLGGGGPFADAVRAADARWSLGDDAAHWMAIHAMDQTAHWLHARLPMSALVRSPYLAGAALDMGRLPIFAPAAWLHDTDTLPHSWDVTSDAIAAYTAGAIDAARLLLLKPVDGTPDALADAALRRVAPHDLRIACVDARRPDLAACLVRGSIA